MLNFETLKEGSIIRDTKTGLHFRVELVDYSRDRYAPIFVTLLDELETPVYARISPDVVEEFNEVGDSFWLWGSIDDAIDVAHFDVAEVSELLKDHKVITCKTLELVEEPKPEYL